MSEVANKIREYQRLYIIAMNRLQVLLQKHLHEGEF